MHDIILIRDYLTLFYLYLYSLTDICISPNAYQPFQIHLLTVTLPIILYLEELMKLKEFHVIADITIKMLLYTHLIRIWTNNNHLKILSWLKYKSFHVYGTLNIFHLFSRKKDEYAWTLTTDWINIVSPSPSSSLLLSVSPSFIIVHSWTNHVRCIH